MENHRGRVLLDTALISMGFSISLLTEPGEECSPAEEMGASLDFQQHFAFPTCLFLPEPGEIPGWAALSGPSRTPCPPHPPLERAVGKVSALPAFSLPLPTGIRLLGSKILPAIFKVLSEPTRLLLPVTDPAVRIFSCFSLPLLQARVATARIPSSFPPAARPGGCRGFGAHPVAFARVSGVLGSSAEVWGWRDGIYAKPSMEGRAHPLRLIVHMAHPGKKWDPFFQLSGKRCFPQTLLFPAQSQCWSSPGLRWALRLCSLQGRARCGKQQKLSLGGRRLS